MDDYCIDFKTDFDQNTVMVLKLVFSIIWLNDIILWWKVMIGIIFHIPVEILRGKFLDSYLSVHSARILWFPYCLLYVFVPKMRNLYGLSVMCQVASLAVTHICLAINERNTNIDELFCIAIGILWIGCKHFKKSFIFYLQLPYFTFHFSLHLVGLIIDDVLYSFFFLANSFIIAFLYGPIGFLITFFLFVLTIILVYRAIVDSLVAKKQEATQM